MRKRRPPPTYTVEAEHNGTRHQGEYTVQSGIVVVTYCMAKNQATLGSLPADFLARQLLQEILDANKWQF